MDELEPCPFCGCKDVKYYSGWKKSSRDFDKSDGRSPGICCGGDDCSVGMKPGWYGRGISDEKAKDITIKLWNRRTKKE
jgi:hypothetical protein